jgi:tRNA pseudouridine38-40 synthase
MSRYFITFSYDGTAYHGWQIQPHSISVQEQLQKALSTLLRQTIEVVGAGRTDTGVHARKMVAHFDFGELDCSQLVYKLNKMLPKDIAVYKVEQVSEDMHARFSAKSRTYHYFMHLSKDPFLRAYSWQMYGDLDFDLMNKAALVLMEYRDFTSFSKVNTDTKTNDCTITEAHWDRVGDNQWRFTISANRFLRNMVRAIVGTLVEVGRGKLTIEQLRQVIEAKDRCRAGDSVPGNALFLVEVLY